jgi:hypothetical protein
MTQENIEAILSQENYAQIIDADEFYFQKAQDALHRKKINQLCNYRIGTCCTA